MSEQALLMVCDLTAVVDSDVLPRRGKMLLLLGLETKHSAPSNDRERSSCAELVHSDPRPPSVLLSLDDIVCFGVC